MYGRKVFFVLRPILVCLLLALCFPSFASLLVRLVLLLVGVALIGTSVWGWLPGAALVLCATLDVLFLLPRILDGDDE